MRIKKTPTGNEYISVDGILVRNYIKKNVQPIGLSDLFSKADFETILSNEEANSRYPKISDEKFSFPKVVIVSDGYQFEEKHLALSKLPKDVCILAVNGALRKWKIQKDRSINAYVINNPYKDCLSDLPSNYFPTCIPSIRANSEFLKRYSGNKYTYVPTPERFFGLKRKEEYYIDDYRNSVCACISLAYRFRVNKLALFCCDESFDKKREAAIQLKNKLWTYPQHIKAEKIIDANLHWLRSQENSDIEVVNYSQGGEYKNATYINSEEELIEFFTTDGDNSDV